MDTNKAFVRTLFTIFYKCVTYQIILNPRENKHVKIPSTSWEMSMESRQLESVNILLLKTYTYGLIYIDFPNRFFLITMASNETG